MAAIFERRSINVIGQALNLNFYVIFLVELTFVSSM